METTTNRQHVFEIVVAALSALLVVFVAVIKISSKDIYGTSATVFQTCRIVLYVIAALLAIAGLGTFIGTKYLKITKLSASLAYVLWAAAALLMVLVQAFSIAGEFENQGKTLQDALYAVVYLILAASMYLMSAMVNPKPVIRMTVIIASIALFLIATVTDFGFLMGKAGRINSETSAVAAIAMYVDEIAVLLAGTTALIHEREAKNE